MNEQARASALGHFNDAVNRAYTASKGIRVIDPTDKGEDEKTLNEAWIALQPASCVYILGYGFDENNSRRLRLEQYLWQSGGSPPKSVMFTNYGNVNRVNKRASQVFFRDYVHFVDPAPPVYGGLPSWYFEKSARNVYDALDLDFESLEQQLLAGSPLAVYQPGP